MNQSWYALHVKPRFEKYVSSQLEAKGFEVFLPTYISDRKWSDRTKSLSLPLFPGYVFCNFDIHARFPVLITPGVMTVLGAGKTATPVDESELSSIRQIGASRIQSQPCPYLTAGEMVRVESGPLKGLVGLVVRTKGSDQFVVSISLLRRSVSVEIARNCVKPIREDAREVAGLLPQHAAGPNNFELASSDYRRIS